MEDFSLIPLLDIARGEKEAGEKDVFNGMMDDFMNANKESLESLKDGIENKNTELIALRTQAIADYSLSIGALRLSAISKRINKCCNDEQQDEIYNNYYSKFVINLVLTKREIRLALNAIKNATLPTDTTPQSDTSDYDIPVAKGYEWALKVKISSNKQLPSQEDPKSQPIPPENFFKEEKKELPNEETQSKITRKNSRFLLTQSGEMMRPQYDFKENQEKIWEIMGTYLPTSKEDIEKQIITHIEYSLAKTRFNFDMKSAYRATALSVRDRLIEAWNDTNNHFYFNHPKRVYYLSMEYLLGRLLQNNLINMNLDTNYKNALEELGYKLEDIYEEEIDPALGNGGLGRLAACYLDSLTTLNIPAWGYGLRFKYGIFKQVIVNGEQMEIPDYWLESNNPWEIERPDVRVRVKFYGNVIEKKGNDGVVRSVWENTSDLYAIACDTPIQGYDTFNCNNLRLWKALPLSEFDFNDFNSGDYFGAIEDRQKAECITNVLYPNDNTPSGKELRLKQEYFFVAATIHDIIRRFIKTQSNSVDWTKLNEMAAIQLNDTHPTLAIIELLRILIDEHNIETIKAYDIVRKVFAFTNHTVLPEALEKWPVDMLGKLLPRHLQLIYLVNHYYLEEFKKSKVFNGDMARNISCIEESTPKAVRMANLCIMCSHKVNGVARIHSDILKNSLFKDFAKFEPKKFTNVTNGVTQRRWIACANPLLAQLITKTLGSDDWLKDLDQLKPIADKAELEEFCNEWSEIKLQNKKRLQKWVKDNCKIDIPTDAMYDVQIKRLHEYKRQLMNILQVINRYLVIKDMKPQERENLTKKVVFFAGKAAPGYVTAKQIIKLINYAAKVINSDADVGDKLKVVFLPNYNVSLAQIIIPASDLNQQISTAGTEASGTSCMKFVMNGSIILGTRDGANIEIEEKIGTENMFPFGMDVNRVNQLRNEILNGKRDYAPYQIKRAIDEIRRGRFGNLFEMNDYFTKLFDGGDFYLVCPEFNSYLDAIHKVF